ncbi:hypothetical protein LV457_00270 [Mycobacterium sp. MYCO198283]|uniref:hypothetical protein n=1 Tax=Mycobacterium sp. MYCO198283 TaxID=2883505 RepID=UPI001E2F1C8C|nr:hypothetical protein [Mycobacterium sp. MYCO198283]MCG5430734.1 hypothetical protein [Mycobacterium sp. MYCO198283]
MTVTSEDVRALLDGGDDAVLIQIEGRTEVVSAAKLETPDYQGALQLASAADLPQRLRSGDVSDRDLQEQATTLSAAVDNLGG